MDNSDMPLSPSPSKERSSRTNFFACFSSCFWRNGGVYDSDTPNLLRRCYGVEMGLLSVYNHQLHQNQHHCLPLAPSTSRTLRCLTNCTICPALKTTIGERAIASSFCPVLCSDHGLHPSDVDHQRRWAIYDAVYIPTQVARTDNCLICCVGPLAINSLRSLACRGCSNGSSGRGPPKRNFCWV